MQGGYISMSTKVLLIFLFLLIQTFLIFLFFQHRVCYFPIFLSCHAAEHPERFNSTLKVLYTLGDKLQQQVETTDHSVWTGPATDKLQQHVVATHRSDKSLCVYWRDLWKSLSLQRNFVAATTRINSVWFDFLQHVAATKLCCRDKDFHKKFSIYTRSDLSLRRVVATCCCN